jgi:cobyrinic acid a,c-diamide synthase
MKGVVIGGTNSGCGKTTLTLGLLAALKERLGRVSAFKVGPDFIDPGHYAAITGAPGRNLDGWMIDRETNQSSFFRHARQAPIAVIEGVMGLYDGYDGKSERGSTAEMAKWLGLPVVLVVNAKSMARSAAALVKGFTSFDPALSFAGVILNQVGGPRHLAYLKEAMEGEGYPPVLGGIPRNEDIAIPERHLGLVTQEDFALSGAMIERLSRMVTDYVDISLLLKILKDTPPPPGKEAADGGEAGFPRVKIGVARDQAFCFYYEDNLDRLREAGAELLFFSPVRDFLLPPDIDALYLGGGYPELHAEALFKNHGMRSQVRAASLSNMPIYGECGGFMYLGKSLTTLEGRLFEMAGALDVRTRMLPRLSALGYREVTFKRELILGETGKTLRGHEFHYSETLSSMEEADCVFRVAARDGSEKQLAAIQKQQTLGTYLHAHFSSDPGAAAALVRAARIYREERRKGK